MGGKSLGSDSIVKHHTRDYDSEAQKRRTTKRWPVQEPQQGPAYIESRVQTPDRVSRRPTTKSSALCLLFTVPRPLVNEPPFIHPHPQRTRASEAYA